MEAHVYELEEKIERTHWWFSVRHDLFARRILAAGLPRTADILDIGTSTGGTLRYLAESGFTNVVGVDSNPVAVSFCARNALSVRQGDACDLPFPPDSFDYVLACDIIEHLDDDVRAAREVRRVLRPNMSALFTVPGFKILWGHQDEVWHHKRRYTPAQLRRTLEESGLEVTALYCFNYMLFLPILAVRWTTSAFHRPVEENSINSPIINFILKHIFALDVATAPWIRPPFGVSIAAEVRKR